MLTQDNIQLIDGPIIFDSSKLQHWLHLYEDALVLTLTMIGHIM